MWGSGTVGIEFKAIMRARKHVGMGRDVIRSRRSGKVDIVVFQNCHPQPVRAAVVPPRVFSEKCGGLHMGFTAS